MIIKPVPWRPATSAALAAALSDETGTGFVVFSDSPVFTTQISTPKIVTASGNLEITTAGAHLLLELNAVADKYAQLGYYEAGTLKWNIYNDYSNDNLVFGTALEAKISIQQGGNVGIGITVPTAVLHLKAGTATANTAPLQFTSGPVETTPRAGLVEYDGRFIVTESDTTNRFLVQAASSTKTTAGAPYTNDGFVTVVINGTSVKLMTTA